MNNPFAERSHHTKTIEKAQRKVSSKSPVEQKSRRVAIQLVANALAPDTYDEEMLRTISGLADDDARIAIQTLKNAAYLAEKDNRKKIRPVDVRRAWNAAKDLKKTYLLHKLTDHHRLIFELVAKNKKILSGDLWRVYLKTCSAKKIKPIAVRTYSDCGWRNTSSGSCTISAFGQ